MTGVESVRILGLSVLLMGPCGISQAQSHRGSSNRGVLQPATLSFFARLSLAHRPRKEHGHISHDGQRMLREGGAPPRTPTRDPRWNP